MKVVFRGYRGSVFCLEDWQTRAVSQGLKSYTPCDKNRPLWASTVGIGV